MKSQADINRIFNKFAGQEVRVKEKWVGPNSLKGRLTAYMSGPQFFKPRIEVKLDWTDATLLKMLFTAKAHGLKLFLHYPGHTVPRHAPFGPPDVRGDRVTAYLEKARTGNGACITPSLWVDNLHPKCRIHRENGRCARRDHAFRVKREAGRGPWRRFPSAHQLALSRSSGRRGRPASPS